MPSFQTTQDSLIQALVLLRKTYPELPAITWAISAHPTVEPLEGASFGPNSVDVLIAYERALGGEIAPKHMFDHNGVRMQSLLLETSFAEMPIQIRGAVPAPTMSHLSLVAA